MRISQNGKLLSELIELGNYYRDQLKWIITMKTN